MKISHIFLSIALLYPVSTLGGEESPFQFAISVSPTHEIVLLLNDRQYLLKKNNSGWLLPSSQDVEGIKKGLPPQTSWEEFILWIQTFHAFQISPKGKPLIGTIGDLYYQFDRSIPMRSLIRAAPHIAFLLGRKDQLRQLIILSDGPDSQDKALSYCYLIQLEKNWLLERELLANGLANFPSNRLIRQFAQFFSLSIAEAILKSYEAELYKAGIFRVLGMKENPEGLIDSFFDSRIGQGLFNTTNFFTIMLTDYEDDLLLVWENQMDQIRKTKRAILELKRKIMSGGELSGLQDEEWEKRHYFSFTSSSFFKQIIKEGLYFGENYQGHYLPYPSLSSLGIEIAVDFMDNSQWHAAAGEKNIEKFSTYDGMIPALPIPHAWRSSWLQFSNLFNLYTLGALPKHLVRFKETRYGKKIIDTFHLNSSIKWIETHVPRRLSPFVIFLALEVPDGHIIYIIRLPILAAQAALGGLGILSHDDSDIKKIKELIQKQFSSQN